MENLFKQLISLSGAKFNPPAIPEKIIQYQKELAQNDIALLPADFLLFLHRYNGFAYQGAFVFGIQPFADYFADILGENALADIPDDKNIVILGSNEYDYLAYNTDNRTYQILDKYDFSVLTEYDSGADAIRHILRLDTI